ncbi:MAG: glycosyltransferase [Bacteroidota bacterium]
MRICFLADAASIHTRRWCSHFAALGHEIHLISFKNAEVEGATLHYIDAGAIAVSGGNWKVLLQSRKISRVLRNIKPDVLHAHYATSYGIAGALAGYQPYVITCLGSDVLISPVQSRIIRILLKLAFSRANLVTVMADHMKIVATGLGLCKPEKIRVLPFGIDSAVFNSEQRSLPGDRFVITSTRNFEKVYNLPHLLKAVAKIKDQVSGIKLILIGDGTQRQQVEDMVRELGLDTFTEFKGKIPQPEISSILQHSHIFVSVSRSDGNNVSLNEAMACGTYPVATRIPANTQWINDGVNGSLIEIDDVGQLAAELLRVYHEYNTVAPLAAAENSIIIRERADWNHNMEAMMQYYKELCRQ